MGVKKTVTVDLTPGICENPTDNVQPIGYPVNENKVFGTREEAEQFMNKIVENPDEVKCYGVAIGRKPGVYFTWKECQEQYVGLKYSMFRKFYSISEAETFVATFSRRRKSSLTPSKASRGKYNYDRGDRPIHDRDNLPQRLRHITVNWNEVAQFYTDGSCLMNGYFNAQGGYGVCGANHTVHLSGPLEGKVTNVRAELTAVIKALEKAIELGMDHVIIKTDSLFVMDVADHFLSTWRKNGYRKTDSEEISNKLLVITLDALLSEITVLFEHVKAHKDNEYNNCADKMARQEAVLMDWRPHYRILKGKDPPIIIPVKHKNTRKQKKDVNNNAVEKHDKETQTSLLGDSDHDEEKENSTTTCCFGIINIPRFFVNLFTRRRRNTSDVNVSME